MFNYIPTILAMIVMPRFTKKIGKIKVLFGGFLLYGVGLIAQIVAPTTLSMIYAGLVLQGIGHAALYSCLFAVVGDVVEHLEWKDGIREEGLTYSVTSFGMKFGTGLGTAALGWILALGRYDGTAVVQSATAITAIKSLFLYLPLVITVIVLVIWYLFMGIDKIYPTIKKELDERRFNQ
jgi:GPH family glycoside/pentoside/hexuronide:cation symporter